VKADDPRRRAWQLDNFPRTFRFHRFDGHGMHIRSGVIASLAGAIVVMPTDAPASRDALISSRYGLGTAEGIHNRLHRYSGSSSRRPGQLPAEPARGSLSIALSLGCYLHHMMTSNAGPSFVRGQRPSAQHIQSRLSKVHKSETQNFYSDML
jgi:hypothetical protein